MSMFFPTVGQRNPRRYGFTMIEMVICISIIAILSGLAVASSRELLPRFRTREAARNFSNSMASAKMQAVQQQKEARVRITDYDTDATSTGGANAGAWIVEVGNKRIGSTTWTEVDFTKYDMSKSGEDYLKDVSLNYESGAVSGPTNCSCTDSVVFSPLGRITNPSDDFESEGDIRFTFVNKSHNHQTAKDWYYVRVYRQGMARIDPTLADLYSAEEGGTADKSSY